MSGSSASLAAPPATPGRSDSARLARIRALHQAIAPGRHALAFDGEGALIVADGPRGEKLEIVRFLAIASDDERDFLAGAAEAVGFLLGLVDRAARKVRELAPAAERADERPSAEVRTYAAEAGILCKDPAFKAFLMARHGLESPATDERTAQRLRTLLRVTSRAELNSDADAAARWKQLRGAFEAWKMVGR